MSKIDCVNCKYYNFNTFNDTDWCSHDNEQTGLCGYCEREFEDLEEATQIYDNKEEECNKWYQVHLEQAAKIKDLETELNFKQEARIITFNKYSDVVKKCEDLQKQLAEKEYLLNIKDGELNNTHKLWQNKIDEVNQLKQQLAEKEKEIYAKNSEINKLKCEFECFERFVKQNDALVINANQDKISFAVEQLIQAKEYIKKSFENMWNGNAEMTCRDRSIIDGIYNKIDNQITDLKGNEDE